MKEVRIRKDIIGQRFGNLVAICFDGKVGKHYNYLFKCDCGESKLINRADVTSGKTKSCDCGRSKKFIALCNEMIGKKYGYWLVTGLPTNYKTPCICECGKHDSIHYLNLVNGISKSCGCMEKDRLLKEKGVVYDKLSGRFWSGILAGARKRDIDFNLTIFEAYDMLEKQNFICPYTGRQLFLGPNKGRHSHERNLSLDRIDSSKDYSVSNCEWVYKKINTIKNQYSKEWFLYVCKLVENPIKVFNETRDELTYKSWKDMNRNPRNFLFTQTQAFDLIVDQDFCCAITGLPIYLSPSGLEYKKGARTASIDRIDSSKGYFLENIWWVNSDVNMIKGSLTMMEFINIAREINNYQDVLRNKYE